MSNSPDKGERAHAGAARDGSRIHRPRSGRRSTVCFNARQNVAPGPNSEDLQLSRPLGNRTDYGFAIR